MYKLIIADDEKIIRLGLKNVVNWGDLGFELTEIFADGQDIIEYLDYMVPDVILTDIKMNHVSGLDVAKYVYKHGLPCKIILISGYQEFDLAVQGLKYGAEDFLLKPTNVDSIVETFTKMKKQLDMLYAKQQKNNAEKERIEEAIPLLEDHFFSSLVLGGMIDNEEYVRSCIKILYPDLDIENSACMLSDIKIIDYDTFMEQIWEYSRDQFELNLSNFFRIYKENYIFHIVYKSGPIIEVIVIHNGCEMDAGWDQIMEQLLQALEESFCFKANYQIRRTCDSILDIGRLQDDTWEMWFGDEENSQHINEKKKLIMSNISVGNVVTAQKLFHNILDELDNQPAINRNNMVIEILSTMNEVFKEINSRLSQSLQVYFNYSLLASMSRKEEIRDYCDRIFDRIRIAEDKKEYYDTNSFVNKAKLFIQENIYRDISQEETANQLYICPSYLSRLFKKQTGESFTQYVTRLKIEKAVELLKDPKYKTYQVGELLGYKTPRYFSRLFRQYTGMKPSEYRGKVLRIGGGSDESC